jgi:hypothetical protein
MAKGKGKGKGGKAPVRSTLQNAMRVKCGR